MIVCHPPLPSDTILLSSNLPERIKTFEAMTSILARANKTKPTISATEVFNEAVTIKLFLKKIQKDKSLIQFDRGNFILEFWLQLGLASNVLGGEIKILFIFSGSREYCLRCFLHLVNI